MVIFIFGNWLISLNQLVQMIPYIITILALVVYALQKRAQVLERTRRFQERELVEQAEGSA